MDDNVLTKPLHATYTPGVERDGFIHSSSTLATRKRTASPFQRPSTIRVFVACAFMPANGPERNSQSTTCLIAW